METKKKAEPKVVIIRTRDAGVHVGELVSRDGNEVILSGAHRIWRWRGANTLNELAARGASQDYTRISERAPGLVTIVGVAEVLETTPEAAANLRTPRWPS